jgi:hypothetical protein
MEMDGIDQHGFLTGQYRFLEIISSGFESDEPMQIEICPLI